MVLDKYNSKPTEKLRQRAEASILKKESILSNSLKEFSPEETKALVHELLVHQIELEMQNEELCSIRRDLELSQTRYFDLFNQAPVGYVCLNDKGLILESNLTAALLLGREVNELVNQPLSRHIFREDQDIFYHHRRNLFNSGLAQECELRMIKNTKTSESIVIWARLESSVSNPDLPLTNHGWNCRVVISDITDHRKIREQLHQAQKMETIGLLAGGVAHDYNNKMAIIIGYAELALSKECSPQSARLFFREILTAALHSATITRQLLTIARKQMISPVAIDLNQAIEGIGKMLKQAVGEEIELVLKFEPDLYPTKMDTVQTDQILLNLCLNAKAAIAGRGQVKIETRNAIFDAAFCRKNPEYIEGKFVTIEFSDTGCGITDETIAKIFEPFFTTRKVGQGTGLGLSAVEGIVKQNHGFIIVTSKAGVGTTFKIFLPAFTGALVEKHLEMREEVLPVNGEMVLVVENELSLLPMIKMMLEQLGFKVLTASSSLMATNLAQKHKHEIILLITDVIMPEMTGCEVHDLVQKVIPQIKTIFMSGHPENILTQRGFKGSNLNFLQKPFSINDLAEKISRLSLTSGYPRIDKTDI